MSVEPSLIFCICLSGTPLGLLLHCSSRWNNQPRELRAFHLMIWLGTPCDASGSSAKRPQPVPLDRRLNGQQWARLPQGHLVGSTPICHHHAVLSPERRAAPRPRQSSAVNSSLIRSAEDTGWGEAKIGEGRRPRIRERLLGHDTLTRRDAQCDRFCRPRSKPSHWFSKPTSAAGLSLHRTAVSRCGLQC
jgi:hypothetical protein